MSITFVNPVPKLNFQSEAKPLNLDLSQKDNVKQALDAGKDDGLDQIYLLDTKTNTSYVIEGDGLDISSKLEAGKIPSAIIEIDGKETRVQIKGVDAENNTYGDVLTDGSTYGKGFLAAVGGAVGGLFTMDKLADFGVRIGSKGALAGTVGVGVALGLGVIGASLYFGNAKGQDTSGLKEFLK